MAKQKQAKQKKQKKKVKVNTGKAVLYFIEQKMLEIIGIGLLGLVICLLGYWDPLKIITLEPTWNDYFIVGLLYLAMIAMGIIAIIMIYNLCEANWKWAKRRASK